jgi:hypothetical protein
MGTGAVTLGIKRQGRETKFSSPSSAKIKKVGAIPPLSVKSSWRGAYLFKDQE